MKILAFGIHPDDIEIGCGGTVAVAVDDGQDVVMVDLSDGSASSNGTVDERRAEAQAAATVLGVARRLNLGLPDTRLSSEDPDQTRRLVTCIRSERPDIAFVPLSDDAHPDHVAGGQLVRRALYFAGVHGYGSGEPAHRVSTVLVYQGRAEVRADVVVDVSSTFERKMEAIRAHVSQFGGGEGSKATPLNDPDFLPFVEARSRVYGRQIGVTHGEPFVAASPLAIRSFDAFRTVREK